MSAGKKALIGLTIIILITVIIIIAVRSKPLSPPQQQSSGLKGKLVIKGSDTLLPLAQAWAEEFMRRHPDVSVSVTGGGSGVGIAALLDGTCDIANASRNLTKSEAERAKSLGIQIHETKVAIDGISVIVNPQNPINSLTISQLKDIYTGRIKSWKELGGQDLKITAVGRDTPSGTYELFKEKVLGEENYAPTVLNTPSNNQIAMTVSQDLGAIGYVGVAYADKFAKSGKVKIIAIAKDKSSSPLLPTKENIKSEKYPLYRYLFNYTREEPKGIVKEYLDFVLSPEGQKKVEEIGYIPLK
ncbi:PstS family phosphate ABC transporter substrate-binding protein [bacterium]|nr:PstS family phosphate ABC transporter substrate-binding protein [bacterium]